MPSCATCDEVATVLEELNAAQAPTLAQRVRDTLEHCELVAEACVFDAEKREHSFRVQCHYWMSMALIEGDV